MPPKLSKRKADSDSVLPEGKIYFNHKDSAPPPRDGWWLLGPFKGPRGGEWYYDPVAGAMLGVRPAHEAKSGGSPYVCVTRAAFEAIGKKDFLAMYDAQSDEGTPPEVKAGSKYEGQERPGCCKGVPDRVNRHIFHPFFTLHHLKMLYVRHALRVRIAMLRFEVTYTVRL